MAHPRQRFELSNTQSAILLARQLYPDSIAYQICGYAVIRSNLNLDLFKKAVQLVVSRHDALQFEFGFAEEKNYMSVNEEHSFNMDFIDFSSHDCPRSACLTWMETESSIPLAPDNVLYKMVLVKSGDKHYYWYLKISHLIADGYSMSLIFNMVADVYNNPEQSVAEKTGLVRNRYTDFAAEEKNYLSSAAFNADRIFWLHELQDADHTAIGTHTYTDIALSLQSRKNDFLLTRDVKKKIDAFCTINKVSFLHYVIAVVWIAASRYFGVNDLMIGLPVLNRPDHTSKKTVGAFVKMLPLCLDAQTGQSLHAFLLFIKRKLVNSIKHYRFPVDDLLHEIHAGAYNIVLSYQKINYDVQFGHAPATIKYIVNDQQIEDLAIHILEYHQDQDISIILSYRCSAFDDRDSNSFSTVFEHICNTLFEYDSLVTPLKHINCLSPADRNSMELFNDTHHNYPVDKTIVDLVEDQARRSPGSVALVCGGLELTYGQLNEQANQLAHCLTKRFAITRHDKVGIMLPRSSQLVVAMLAVLKASAAYVPIDHSFPPERISYMVKDSGIKVLISQSTLMAQEGYDLAGARILLPDTEQQLISTYPVSDLQVQREPADLMYIIYTSGSTGRPKGVEVEHRHFMNTLFAHRELYGLDDTQCTLQSTNSSFDVSLLEIFVPLSLGGKIVIAEQSDMQDAGRLIALIAKEGVTDIQGTPGFISSLLAGLGYSQQGHHALALKRLCIGGESLNKGLVEKIRSLLPGVCINNHYGPTETAIDATAMVDVLEFDINCIGRPLGNTRVYIVDGDGQLLPVGFKGEIWIGGRGVSRGYLNQKELTAEKFVPDPFDAGGRLYRTGDVGCWCLDGSIEFIGRKDEQVKIRGYRIELGEIEQAMLHHEGVRRSAVLALEEKGGGHYLAGYIETDEPVEQAVRQVREMLEGMLPAYMMPSYITALEKFPETPGGKTAKMRLPMPQGTVGKEGYEPARTAMEKLLVEIWEEVLETKGIGIRNNFFETGGHSIKATLVLSRIYQCTGIRLDLRVMFTHPTIELLAGVLSTEHGGKDGFTHIRRVEEKSSYDASHAQRRLWILNQLDSQSTAYNMFGAYRIAGDLKTDCFTAAFQDLTARHESLRTVFIVDEKTGMPRQKIVPSAALDFRVQQPVASNEELDKLIEQESHHVFDLQRGPLIRVVLIHIGEQEHVLLFNMHHIISDAWSVEVLIKDVFSFYHSRRSGEPFRLPPLPLHYRDFASWQLEKMSEEAFSEHADYWKNRLKAPRAVLELPGSYARPQIQTFNGNKVEYRLERHLSEGLHALSRSRNSSLFMLILSTVKVLMYKYTGQHDLIIGAPMAGRNHPELEGQIGFYVNLLALRSSINGSKEFLHYLDEVKEVVLEAYEHQSYPYDGLMDLLEVERDLSRSALFDVVVDMHTENKNGSLSYQDSGLCIESIETGERNSKFDLTYSMEEGVEGDMVLTIEYNTGIYSRDYIDRMLDHYRQLLNSVLKNPGQKLSELNYLSPEEKTRLVELFNDTHRNYPVDKTIVDLVEDQARRSPGSIALVCGGLKLTYGQLNEQANQLAHCLTKRFAITRHDKVGIMLPRSSQLIVAMLAVLKASAAYVPIDHSFPPERISYMVKDSGIKVLISQSTLMAQEGYDLAGARILLPDTEQQLISTYPVSDLQVQREPADLMYIIYTSGSTGRPKGVEVEHRHFMNTLFAHRELYGLDDTQCTLQSTNSSFDVSLLEIFVPLSLGGKIVIAEQSDMQDAGRLIALIAKEGVTDIQGTPGFISSLLAGLGYSQQGHHALALKRLCIGGESLNKGLVEKIRSLLPGVCINNHYGPTETAIDATAMVDVLEFDINCIGRPLGNTRVYIVDGDGQLLPVGFKGEIWIGGRGVSRGYLNQKELTAEKFVPDPFDAGGRLYRTGDVGCWCLDGSIEFIGRKDEQVKIRGYRIELGEIEQAMLHHEGVRRSAVLALEEKGGGHYLAGYIETDEPVEQAVRQVREMLEGMLPAYMMPSYITALEKFPETPGGKTDKMRLPMPQGTVGKEGYEPARTAMEKLLVEIWEEVLETKEIGIRNNFFETGGHSLRAIQVIQHIHQELGFRISLQHIFLHPTIEGLARELASLAPASFNRIEKAPDQPWYALSHAQKRLWTLCTLWPDQVAYNMAGGFFIEGKLDDKAFEAAFETLIDRHESLRTSFILVNDELMQLIYNRDAFGTLFFRVDLSVEKDAEALAHALMEKEARFRFDLEKGPLIRISLIRLEKERHLFLLNIHHIICDGLSVNLLTREVLTVYNAYKENRNNPLPLLNIQYKDYAVWQHKILQGERLDFLAKYWINRLGDPIPVLNLPVDYQRPSIQSFSGDDLSFSLSPELSQRLQSVSKEHNTTIFALLFTAYSAFLYRLTRQVHMVLGTSVAGRNYPDLEGIIGFFINTLPIRVDIDPECSFSALLALTHQHLLSDYEHQDMPFDLLLQYLPVKRDESRTPVFQSRFVFDEFANGHATPGNDDDGIRFREAYPALKTAKFELSTAMWLQEGRLAGNMEYRSDLFRRSTIEHFCNQFQTLLEDVSNDPGKKIAALDIHNEQQRKEIEHRKEKKQDAKYALLKKIPVTAKN